MFRRTLLVTYKVFFALLALYAIAQETVVLVDRGTYNFINFWSYFTNQSNLFVVIMLLTSAYIVLRGSTVKSGTVSLLRGASSLYLIITGVVFAVLLSGADPKTLTAVPIDNTILHHVMPVVMLADWLIDQPARRLAFRRVLLWLVYPIVYVICALIRGAISGFYPYPFLNPANGGYGPVLMTVIAITIFVVIMAFLLTRLPLRRRSKRH